MNCHCTKFHIPFLLILLSLLFYGCNSSNSSNTAPPKAASPDIFTDITQQSKLRFIHDPAVKGDYFFPELVGPGAALFDYDNDNDLDVYLINGALPEAHRTNRLFRQESDKTFTDVTEFSGLGNSGYGMGLAVGDVDNDADLDVYIASYGPDALYRNNGNGTFTNISPTAGIQDSLWGTSALFFDYDRDGFLDIYVANYVINNPAVICNDKVGRQDYCGPLGYRGEPDLLYHNNGNGTFTDVSLTSGIGKAVLKGLGVVSADFNGDGYPDLYVANDGEANHLWINQQNGTFLDKGYALGAAVNAMGQPEASMGVALGDADQDGDFDLFMTHLRDETNTFYRNYGEIGFQDETSLSGLGGPSLPFTGFGSGFFDYDHDGDLDVAVVNGRVTRGPLLTGAHSKDYWDPYKEPGLLFENVGKSRFVNRSNQAPALCSRIENSRGLAFGDIDNDGDLDLLVTSCGGPARLLRNDLANKGHWLMLRAIDPDLRRDAIGARITITAGVKKQFALVSPAYSYLCSNDFRVHFGLGSEKRVDQILVRWPDGTDETFSGASGDQFITLRKGHSKSSNFP